MTALKDGGWLVTWHANHPGESRFDIYAQRYDATGNRVGSETQVNTNTLDVQYIPAVTALNDGGWLVSWSSFIAGNGDDIYFQRYNANGQAVGGETLVINNPHFATQSQSFSDVTALADGGWVVTWEAGGEQDGSVWLSMPSATTPRAKPSVAKPWSTPPLTAIRFPPKSRLWKTAAGQ